MKYLFGWDYFKNHNTKNVCYSIIAHIFRLNNSFSIQKTLIFYSLHFINHFKLNKTMKFKFLLFTLLFGGLLMTYGCGDNSFSCEDGKQNQGETGIDCGGPAPTVPICVLAQMASKTEKN